MADDSALEMVTVPKTVEKQDKDEWEQEEDEENEEASDGRSKNWVSICSERIFMLVVLVGLLYLVWAGWNGITSGNSATHPRKGDGTGEESVVSLPSEEEKSKDGHDDDVDEEETSETRMEEWRARDWGQWTFWDSGWDFRPRDDYCGLYPNRDVPGDDIPELAWQADAVYSNHFLDEASDLMERAKNVIYAEYGADKRMFRLDLLDFDNEMDVPKTRLQEAHSRGGWTTEESFEGMVRRLLHAVFTNDSFTIVMAGNAAAAGHGNHFRQSYMMQFHQIMTPIFERLGVKLVVRNMGRGGIGDGSILLQGALGLATNFGDDIDLILWDGDATNAESELELFVRQAILVGKRVPMVWTCASPTTPADGDFELLKHLHQTLGVHVAHVGTAWADVAVTTSKEQAQEYLPWATRFLKCTPQLQAEVCNDPAIKFNTTCWVPRPDNVIPPTPQEEVAPDQIPQNPGQRWHWLKSRVLAMNILHGLATAINVWSSNSRISGFPLEDEVWHITPVYEAARKKLRASSAKDTTHFCRRIGKYLPERLCSVPLFSRTENTPRVNGSLTSIVVPAEENGPVPQNEQEMVYNGPDVPNPSLELDKDALNVTGIVSARRTLRQQEERNTRTAVANVGQTVGATTARARLESHTTLREMEDTITGTSAGWRVVDEYPGQCDGTYDAICGRLASSSCLLYNHMDSPGRLAGKESDGWLVMALPLLRHGIVVVQLDVLYPPEGIPKATEDDGGTETTSGTLVTLTGRLGGAAGSNVFVIGDGGGVEELLPSSFELEYAVNGIVDVMDKAEFVSQVEKVPHGLALVTLLDDGTFVGQEGDDVQVAIRMKGCGDDCTLFVSHIYWA